MTNAGATPLPARGRSSRRLGKKDIRRQSGRGSALAAPLGLGCGILAAIGALAATTDLAARLFPPAAESRSVAGNAPRQAVADIDRSRRAAALRVVQPPVPSEKPAVPNARRIADAHRDQAEAARSAAAQVRHRMAPPAVMTWIPAHLLDRPRGAKTSRFEPAPSDVLASNLDGTGRFVPPPAEPAVAAAASPPVPAVRVAAVVPAPVVLAAVPAAPATAEEALEAVLVPTPRARPDHAGPPPVASLRTRPVPPVRALAYARPDAGAEETDKPLLGGLFSRQPPRTGNGVAIYDIGAATVYLPNGERLEAHSGLGRMRDNPRFVHAKNRGATPPHTYDLRLRESLFHGVQAIRLTPIGGERRIYNRVGLLAHTYMLGARGDSNGCVSFKDYKRFLAAFRRGEVRRLVVVSHMSDPSSRLASLFGRRG